MDLHLSYILIVVITVVSILAFGIDKLWDLLVFNPYLIHTKKQYWRFFTAGFIHGNVAHLAINMFVLFQFGNALEVALEYYYANTAWKVILAYFAIYIPALAISCIYTYFKHRNNPHYNAVGASGAVSAVVFAVMGIKPLETLYVVGFLPVRAFLYGFLFLAVSWILARSSKDHIGHDAHFYGALYGLIAVFILMPLIAPRFFYSIAYYFTHLI